MTMTACLPETTFPLHVIVLAAGQGMRMVSDLPKVLQTLAGKPLLLHVFEHVYPLKPQKIITIIGHRKELIYEYFSHLDTDCEHVWVEQEEQKGTAHAASMALPFSSEQANWLILCGDVPLIRSDTLADFLFSVPQTAVGLFVDHLEDPSGYGRVVRDEQGCIANIVEDKDALAWQKNIQEVNAGIMFCPASVFRRLWPEMSNQNTQGEYYLTELVSLAYQHGISITSYVAPSHEEALGVNNRVQLAQLERLYQARLAEQLMHQGVHILDPSRFDVRGVLTCGKDVSIDVGCVFLGQVHLDDGVSIGPYCVIKDSHLGPGTQVEAYCHLDGCHAQTQVSLGPFARIRPTTKLASGSKVGNFVEVKNTSLGGHSKANHLTYLGDACVKERVNIGAGTVTCNYDGVHKFQTSIGADVFVGSGCMLVAPIKIGQGATIGAGSVVSKHVPEGQLTVARAKQTTLPHWKRPEQKDLNKAKDVP